MVMVMSVVKVMTMAALQAMAMVVLLVRLAGGHGDPAVSPNLLPDI